MMVLSLATFWLPPNSPEKMWTGLMDVLLICLYLLQLDALLPSLGDYSPHIGDDTTFRQPVLIMPLSLLWHAII